MLNNTTLPTSYTVPRQVPGFVIENHDKFVKFLTNYYEYLDQDEGVNDYIRNIISFMDVDQTTNDLLNNFFEELKELPYNIVADKRLLAKHLYDLYSSKGTIQSFKLLFAILFNEQINVLYPSDNILRASDGTWKQESFFTLETKFGSLPTDGTLVDIEFENLYGKFKFKPSKIEKATVNTYRIFFDIKRKVLVIPDQIVYQYDNNGDKTFVGRLIKSPSTLKVVDSGNYWQIGSVIKIPSQDGRDTIARVNGSVNGSITSVEILQHGYEHTENQISIISPFASKPTGSETALNTELISFDPLVYSHTLEINDYTDGIYESIVGLESGYGDRDSYFFEHYALTNDYSYHQVFATEIKSGGSVTSKEYAEDITIQQWFDSRATFVYKFDYIVKTKGEYTTSRGQLSNQDIVLQDSFYYQLYSYVIQSGRNIEEYSKALALIHPAGTKFFAELQKTFSIDISEDIVSSRALSIDRVYVNEVVQTLETILIELARAIFETTDVTDVIASKNVSKGLTETATGVELMGKDVTKPFTETSTGTESIGKDVSKPVDETATGVELIGKDVSKPFDDLSTIADEVTSKAVSKGISDPVDSTFTVDKSVDKGIPETATGTESIGKDVSKPFDDLSTGTESIGKDVTKPFDDLSTGTDGITSKDVSKGLADTSTGTDGITSFDYGKGLADTSTGTDGITSKAVTKPFDDLSTGTESIGKDVSKPFTETSTGTESIGKDVTKPFDDLSTGTDGITSFDFGRTLSHLSTGTDAITSFGYGKGVVDTVDGLDNSLSKSVGKQLDETSTAIESVGKEAIKVFSDSLNVTDDQIDIQTGRSSDDPADITDGITSKEVGKTIDSVAQSVENFIKEVYKSINESSSTTDSFELSVDKTLADTASGTDGITSFDYGKGLLETATGTESIGKDVSKPVEDTVSGTDGITSIEFGKGVLETATGTDGITSKSVDKGIPETATGTESIGKDSTKPFEETATGTDGITSFDIARAVSDTASGTDSVAFIMDKYISVSDSVMTDANDTHVVTNIGYDLEDYDSTDDYALVETFLTVN
jgi:hypothetical protein